MYILHMFLFRPNDARMLIALGDTYQNIEKIDEAKKVKVFINLRIIILYLKLYILV